MHHSLTQQLPDIVVQGHLQSSLFLAELDRRPPITFRSRPLAFSAMADGPYPDQLLRNQLACGDDLAVLAALLSGHASLPRLRGRVQLVCFDPSRSGLAAIASATEEAEAQRLTALTMRLLLMRSLLSDSGLLCVRLAHEPTPCARLVLSTVLGRENHAQDILWHTPPMEPMASTALRQGHWHVYARQRHSMKPDLPDPTARRALRPGPSSSPEQALLRHLLAVFTEPGDTVVTFNAAAEVAAVAATSALQWILTAPDETAGNALQHHLNAHQSEHLSAHSGRSFERQVVSSPG
jgi:hypothetical protein